MVEQPFGSRAQSVEDAEATGEDPADWDSVAGTTWISREARGCWKGRVSGGDIAVYHLQFCPGPAGSKYVEIYGGSREVPIRDQAAGAINDFFIPDSGPVKVARPIINAR
jgi:hypothetical protein